MMFFQVETGNCDDPAPWQLSENQQKMEGGPVVPWWVCGQTAHDFGETPLLLVLGPIRKWMDGQA